MILLGIAQRVTIHLKKVGEHNDQNENAVPENMEYNNFLI